ncbi:MAG: hypothetical protein ACJAST_003340 [Halopseudomonas sp.]|jgi:hypothetical protein
MNNILRSVKIIDGKNLVADTAATQEPTLQAVSYLLILSEANLDI